MDAAKKLITQHVEPPGIFSIGELRLPEGSDEARRCLEIKNILEEFASRTTKCPPLSIAVFGPPGSGKSHGVRAILESLGKKFGEPVFVNLSQLADPKDLAEAFKKAFAGKPEPKDDAGKIAVFFFDEFDAPLKDVTLGWLRWFLSPMQDSQFFFEGVPTKIPKTVFFFAGGTAASLEEFKARAKEAEGAGYADKKVPDFISRLRGFIDIQGINNLDDERPLRRALVLNHLLEKRWEGKRNAQGGFPIDEKFLESLLFNVHYVHGARSMQALLDMCPLAGSDTFTKNHLPSNPLRRLHLSRGLLDEKVIGISAGQRDSEANGMLEDLTNKLLQNGATLAYGGDFVEGGTLDRVVRAAKTVPDELVERSDKRIRNYLGFPSFNKPDVRAQMEKEKNNVDFLELKTLAEPERARLGVTGDGWFPARDVPVKYNGKHHLAWALSLFRMRVRMISDIDALIVVGGKDAESWGRFSGIAEEVMLAVTIGKPVYVLGGRGGAAHAVGRLVGLGDSIANLDVWPADSLDPSAIDKNFSGSFTIPGHPGLPCTIAAVRAHLFEHSVTTDLWPRNGLSIRDNRGLFRTEITSSSWKNSSNGVDCVDLIIKGLSRLNWKAPSPAPS